MSIYRLPKTRTNCPCFRSLMRPRSSWATCGAPNRPSTENGEKFSPFSGSNATARQLGDLRQPEKVVNFSTFTAGTEVRPTEVKLTSAPPHSRFALCPEKVDKLSTLSAGTEVRSTHCVSCAMMATQKGGQFDLLFGAPCDRAAAERYNGSVCCAAAYALSCPLRSLRLCCSRVTAALHPSVIPSSPI